MQRKLDWDSLPDIAKENIIEQRDRSVHRDKMKVVHQQYHWKVETFIHRRRFMWFNNGNRNGGQFINSRNIVHWPSMYNFSRINNFVRGDDGFVCYGPYLPVRYVHTTPPSIMRRLWQQDHPDRPILDVGLTLS